jgi:glycosyltransferase involved in cell wall biosynthesis
MIKDLTIHMMVKNEERYIRQTLRSTLPYVEHAIIIDTGSTDKTIEYIEELIKNYNNVTFLKFNVAKDSINWDGNHLNQELTNLRNKMLEMTKTKYCLQVDGDEIYPESSIRALDGAMAFLNNKNTIGIMLNIKWCTSNYEYDHPGPFPKTLRVFPARGKWEGEFPNEFLWVDGQPITIHDRRCITPPTAYFLHMSMALHPERRTARNYTLKLNEQETACLNI